MRRLHLVDEYQQLMKRLRNGTFSVLGRIEDAEDALQDAFCQLWGNRKDNDESGESQQSLSSGFKRNLGNRRRNLQRHATIRLDIEWMGSSPPPDEVWDTFHYVEQLVDKVLPPLQREVIRLKEFQGLSIKETAQRLGISEAATRMNLSRARKTIRETFKNQRQ